MVAFRPPPGITSIGGAILRGDLLLTDTDLDTYTSLVANYSISWVGWGKNMSGLVEYFFNDMGLREEDYEVIVVNKHFYFFTNIWWFCNKQNLLTTFR